MNPAKGTGRGPSARAAISAANDWPWVDEKGVSGWFPCLQAPEMLGWEVSSRGIPASDCPPWMTVIYRGAWRSGVGKEATGIQAAPSEGRDGMHRPGGLWMCPRALTRWKA